MRVPRLSLLAAATLLAGGALTLTAGPAAAAPQPLIATATGAAEVPGPGDQDGAASGAFTFNPTDNQFCYLVTAENLTEPVQAMHIHPGPAGVAAPPVITLDPAEVNATVEACIDTVTAELGADIVADPASFYLNLLTSDFPDGAVRGQLEAVAVDIVLLAAAGDGTQEVPAPGDTDGTSEGAFGVAENGAFCYEAAAENITLPAAAMHIHRGASGVAGPVVITLDVATLNTTTETCLDVDPVLLAEIVANPGDFYFSIRNADFPDGAVRGQLAVAGTTVSSSSSSTSSSSTSTTGLFPLSVNAGNGGQAAQDDGASAIGIALLAAGGVLAIGSAAAWRRRNSAV